MRSGWQALDLGYLMASRWWLPLMLSAALPGLLLFIPLLVVFFTQPLWAVFIVWWLKPLWERLPLYFASRKIFAEPISLRQVFAEAPALYLRQLLPWLLWRRLSVYRAFDMPVTILEGLSGQQRRQRLQSLHGKYVDTAVSNQLIGFLFEIILCSGLFMVLLFFLPEPLESALYNSAGELALTGQWLYSLCAFIAIFALLPFHAMAGFALYLNRRIELEAWDIEITFRNLARRKQKLASNTTSLLLPLLALSLMVTSSFIPSPAYAVVEHDQASAQQLIEQVLDGEDFGREKTLSKWRFKNPVEEENDKIPQWLIDFIEWLESHFDFFGESTDTSDTPINLADWIKILLIVAFIALLGYLLYRYRVPLTRAAADKTDADLPQVMFGLDVTPESIPRDVPAAVMRLWQNQQPREALGLLYRAALSRLLERHKLAFRASHTEAECATLVKAHGNLGLSDFFNGLTDTWQRLAYGHEVPEADVVDDLCRRWRREMDDAEV